LPTGEALFEGLEVFVGEEGQDHRFESRLGDGLIALGAVFGVNSHPEELAVVEEECIGLGASDQEKAFHQMEDVVNDGRGGDFPFVVAVVMQEAVEKKWPEVFVVDPAELLEI